jgi:hypothetical protein
MCHYDYLFGTGDVLLIQALTIGSIIASITFWAWIYARGGVDLKRYAVPIALWIVFGTLDITITAMGTFGYPWAEGNPLARMVFVATGALGPVVASVLWIALWAGVVFVINKKTGPKIASFLSLAVFYSLAAGHIRGFSSWFEPLCKISDATYDLVPDIGARFLAIVLVGSALAAIHSALINIWIYDDKRR